MAKNPEENLSVSLPVVYDSNSNLLQKTGTGRKAPQIITGLIASLTAFSVGTTIAWTSQTSEKLLNGYYGFPLQSDELGWISSLMPLGAAVLSIIAGPFCDLVGRKIGGLIFVIPSLIGWSLLIWPNSLAMLYAGRFLCGMAAGAFCVFTSLYNSEIGQKEIRGTLGSFLQLMISGGILFDAIVAKYVDIKLYTMLCGLVPIVFAILFLFMPESPVYYVKKQKLTQARSVLKRLRGKNYDVDKEIKEIETYIIENSKHSGIKNVKTCLKKRASKKACVIGFALMIFKCINGIDAITAYTSYIFTNANTGLNAQTGTIILNAFQMGAAIFQSFVVDKSGRRILLLLSSGIMTACLTLVGIVLMLKGRNMIAEENYKYVDYLPIVALVLFCVSFSLGLGPIPWLMMGEIFPQEIKSLAASLATFVSWIVTFAVTKLFLVVDDNLGGDIAFFMFAVGTLVAMLFTIVLVPETKNKTYEEIQQAL